MLIDTGALFSIVRVEEAPFSYKQGEEKWLEGLNGKESLVPFSQVQQFGIGIQWAKGTIGMMK